MKKQEIVEQYSNRKEEINQRLEQFESLRDAGEKRLFKELVFVILSSQSRAEKSWEAVEELERQNLLTGGDKQQIAEVLRSYDIQYEQNKASYIVENRQKLSQPTLNNPEKQLKLRQKLDFEDLKKSREWLVENMKGISWKGASHFLRNIGYGNGFAIVSGYIATSLYQLNLKDSPEQPKNKEEYLEAEKKIQQLSKELEIDIKALDFVLWSMETGEVFK